MSVNLATKLWTMEDIMEASRRGRATIQRHIRKGRLKPLPRESDKEHLRFTEAEVQRYLGLSEKPDSEVRSA